MWNISSMQQWSDNVSPWRPRLLYLTARERNGVCRNFISSDFYCRCILDCYILFCSYVFTVSFNRLYIFLRYMLWHDSLQRDDRDLHNYFFFHLEIADVCAFNIDWPLWVMSYGHFSTPAEVSAWECYIICRPEASTYHKTTHLWQETWQREILGHCHFDLTFFQFLQTSFPEHKL